jgi:hypothetical protein
MQNKLKTLIILLLIILILVGGIYYFKYVTHKNAQTATEENIDQNINETMTYSNLKAGYQIDYPKSFPVSYRNEKSSVGPQVSFNFPKSFTQGTNLAPDSVVEVEIIKGSLCAASDFLVEPDTTGDETQVTIHDLNFNIATSTGAAAGNRYEQVVYAIQNLNMCYGIKLFLHTTTVANYPAGTVKEFDRAKVNEVYNNMLNSFQIFNF